MYFVLGTQTIIRPQHERPGHANNKGADQPANSRGLTIAFVIRAIENDDRLTCFMLSFDILTSPCS